MSQKEIPNPEQIAAMEAALLEQPSEQPAEAAPTEEALPQPAEPSHPVAAEPTADEAAETAKIDKGKGAVFPFPSSARPQAPQKIKEEGSVIVAKRLAEQLGTAPEMKAQMRIDERKMAVLKENELPAIAHFSYRFVYDEIRYWGHIVEWQLTGSQGVGGIGRRHILQALAATSGVQAVEKARKPNIIARNLWAKDWKEKAIEKGQVVEED